MNEIRWKKGFLTLVLFLIVALIANWALFRETNYAAPTEDWTEELQAYFPALVGANYYFSGEGMEFASFSRKITFAEPGRMQIEESSGTNLVQILTYDQELIQVIWVEEEFYAGKNILDPKILAERTSGRTENLILLKAPLVPGTSWADSRFQREISAIDQVITVPAGTFHDVLVVKAQNPETKDYVQYEYYAKNIGLIKRESIFIENGETYGIVSSLRRLNVNP